MTWSMTDFCSLSVSRLSRTSASIWDMTLVLSCTSLTTFRRDSMTAIRSSVSPIPFNAFSTFTLSASTAPRCSVTCCRSALLRALISWTVATSLFTAPMNPSRAAIP